MYPLTGDFRTLAEYLGSRGYATAGFVGNTFYCSYDSGLNRGFTHYEDYVLEKLDAFRTVHLIDLSLKAIPQVVATLGQFLPLQGLRFRHMRTRTGRMPRLSTASSSTGYRGVPSRAGPSSPFSITWTPMRPTSCRRASHTDSAWHRRRKWISFSFWKAGCRPTN